MVATKKFSQFQGPSPIQSGDIVVGLRDVGGGVLDNFQFTGVGSGSGGSVTTVITQANAFQPGNWVRVDVATMLYVTAQADTVAHGEVIGIVIDADATQFTLQQAGYIDAVLGATLLGFGGLVPGNVYFLDTASAGAMVPVDATVNGQVSRPVFVADGLASGWVIPYRGLIVGGSSPSGSGTTTDTSIVVINQNTHNLNLGDVVRVDTQNVAAAPIKYVPALADNLANAQAVGIVKAVNNPNQFVLQFSGYNSGSILTDAAGANIQPATVYYLSPTVQGRVTSTNPTLAGQISKPVYISEQGQINFGVSAGYILPQRPLAAPVTSPAASPYVFMGNLTNTSPDGPYADANIFNNNGGPYRSYLIIFNPNIINGHGLSATGPNPINIGFQFAHNGVFHVGTDCQATLNGVNNSAGAVVPTLWGFIDDTSGGETIATIFPTIPGETGTRVAMSAYEATLTDNGFGRGMAILGRGYFTDWSVGNVPSNHNFTSMGFSAAGNGGAGAGDYTSGIRLVFQGVGAAIFDGTQGYFSIWGLPNS